MIKFLEFEDGDCMKIVNKIFAKIFVKFEVEQSTIAKIYNQVVKVFRQY